jgi:hypothetical protein
MLWLRGARPWYVGRSARDRCDECEESRFDRRKEGKECDLKEMAENVTRRALRLTRDCVCFIFSHAASCTRYLHIITLSANTTLSVGRRSLHRRDLALARPYADNAVFSSLNHVTVLDFDPFNCCGLRRTLLETETWTTVPLSTFGLVVHLDHIFADGAHDTSRVEHHGRDRRIIREGVVNATSAKIPYL